MPADIRFFSRCRFRRAAAVVAAALLPVAAGCSADDGGATATTSSGSASSDARSGRSAPADPYRTLGYTLRWRSAVIVTRGNRLEFFDPSDDVILAHESGNTLSCVESETGRVRWATDLGGDLVRFVGNARLGDGRVLSASETEAMLLDVETGELRDRQRLAHLANTRPLVTPGVAVFGCVNGFVLGHNLRTGYKLWAYDLGASIDGRPVSVGEDVGVVADNGNVLIVNPRNGASQSKFAIWGGLANNPVADDRALYIAGEDQSIWAISRYNGDRLWRIKTEQPLTGQPALHDGTLYVPVPNRGLMAISTVNGEKRWTAEGVRGHAVGLRAGRLITWDPASKTASTIDPSTGDVVDTVSLPNIAFFATDAFADGSLYTATTDGKIAKHTARP